MLQKLENNAEGNGRMESDEIEVGQRLGGAKVDRRG